MTISNYLFKFADGREYKVDRVAQIQVQPGPMPLFTCIAPTQHIICHIIASPGLIVEQSSDIDIVIPGPLSAQ